ncbi:MAG: sulfur carrier protein ThiS [Betaproteobacteria bacterium]|nr:sulfur carrier protein ThiS [Betaproteobacteria bacterium]
MISVSVNGQTLQFDTPVTIRALLERMSLGDRRVALERNGEIVPRGQHGEELIHDGDTIEIVAAVGGG